ncbi:MAG TPA: EscU/YscU/HrcU family type III secretion system export apparatus switch protein [Anaeromyxobacteraceae bacterium]
MADDEEREDRTEEPSGRRLGRAREEGRVPVGHDLHLVASLVAGAAALLVVGPALRTGLVRLAAQSARMLSPRAPFGDLASLFAGPAAAVAAVCLAAGIAGVAAVLTQTRGGFWAHLALPDASRLWRAGRLNLFRKDLWIDLGLSAVKVVALAAAAWSAVRADFATLPALLGVAPGEQLARTFGILGNAAWRLLLAAVAIAGADLAVQRWRFHQSMRMTRHEARREAKEDEGDPTARGRRKRRHREIAKGLAAVEVPRADALVVNPTHVAVAIRYRRDEGRAPRVTAKGKGVLAEFMRDLARRNGVPIVEDVPLARLLHRKVKVGAEIPASTYKAVAAVLAFVYRIAGRAPPAGARP